MECVEEMKKRRMRLHIRKHNFTPLQLTLVDVVSCHSIDRVLFVLFYVLFTSDKNQQQHHTHKLTALIVSHKKVK